MDDLLRLRDELWHANAGDWLNGSGRSHGLKTSHPCHDLIREAGGGVKVRETLERLLDGEFFRGQIFSQGNLMNGLRFRVRYGFRG
jgi:hypothetical protein